MVPSDQYGFIFFSDEPLIHYRAQQSDEITMRAPYGLKHDSYFYYVIKLKIKCLINNLSRMK